MHRGAGGQVVALAPPLPSCPPPPLSRPPPSPAAAGAHRLPPPPPPPYPAPHQLYGTRGVSPHALHSPGHSHCSNSRSPGPPPPLHWRKSFDARRKTRPMSIHCGSAYGNSVPPAPTLERHKSCNQFLANGSCAYGERCRYSHEQPPMPPPPPTSRVALQLGYAAPPPAVVLATTGAGASLPYWTPLPPKAFTSPIRSEAARAVSPTPQLESGYPRLAHHRSATRAKAASVSAATPPEVLGGFKDAVLKQAAARELEKRAARAERCGAADKDEATSAPTCTCEKENACKRSRSGSDADRALPGTNQLRQRDDLDDLQAPVRRVGGVDTHVAAQMHRTLSPYHAKACASPPAAPQDALFAKPDAHQTPLVRSLASASSTITRFGLSSQVDDFVERVDAEVTRLEEQQQAAVEQLQAAVRRLWADGVVDVYGSNYTRLSLPKSDVDCVLTSRSLADASPCAILRQLADAVRGLRWAAAVELLDCAKIPVLKVVYRAAADDPDVMLDLTCGHSPGHSGLSARDLIYSLQAEMPALRPLVLVLKSHLQSRGLNCAFTGGLSSYALVIMVIRFLQACGDEHQKAFNLGSRKIAIRKRHGLTDAGGGELRATKWLFTFSRAGKVVWKTTIGSLLLLFLETYTTFDYRRFGIAIENGGEFFHLPPDKTAHEPELPTTPFIADPIKAGRRIGNAFRMSEAWYALYQKLATGAALANSI